MNDYPRLQVEGSRSGGDELTGGITVLDELTLTGVIEELADQGTEAISVTMTTRTVGSDGFVYAVEVLFLGDPVEWLETEEVTD